jgi:hypothetical protein
VTLGTEASLGLKRARMRGRIGCRPGSRSAAMASASSASQGWPLTLIVAALST